MFLSSIFQGAVTVLTLALFVFPPVPAMAERSHSQVSVGPGPSRSEIDVPHEALNPQNVPAPIIAPARADMPDAEPGEEEGALAKLARIIRVWLFGPDPEIVQEMRCFNDRFGAKTCKLMDVVKAD